MKDKHWKTKFDVYDSATLHLVLCDQTGKSQLNYPMVRDVRYSEDCSGLVVHKWPHYYIFLRRKKLNKRSIAHEIFHVTTAIMRHVGVRYQESNDEPFAYINDWITGWVHFKLGKMKIPSGYKKSLDKPRK